MTLRIIVAGTDTDIGKTVFAAALTRALDGYYWKPVQAGLEGETDSQTVARLSGLPPERIFPEAYRLTTPASPHIAAERDGIEIDPSLLQPPAATPLVIEPAGGLAVPLTRRLLQIDQIATWKAPVVLCASTRLGTINHSLLSIEALKRRAIPILGLAFTGDGDADTERTIAEMGWVKRLGRLPKLQPLEPSTLHTAFADNFSMADILGVGGSGP
jgi:dethiobiotin synthetase